MLNSVEPNITDYKVADSDKTEFQNLVLFAKNLTLKDTRKLDASENTISKWLGSLLLKYYDTQLTYQEVDELLTFAVQYNNSLKAKIDTDSHKFRLSAEDNKNLKMLFQSFLDEIVSSIRDDKVFIEVSGLDETQHETTPVLATINIANAKNTEGNLINPSTYYITTSGKLVINDGVTEVSETDQYFENVNVDYIESSFTNAYDILRYKDYIPIYYVPTNIIPTGITTQQAAFTNALANQNEIESPQNIHTKLSASHDEAESAINGNALLYFHIIFDPTKTNNDEYAKHICDMLHAGNNSTVEFYIVYKEFNQLCRNICDSEMYECALTDIDKINSNAVDRKIHDYANIIKTDENAQSIFARGSNPVSRSNLHSVSNAILFRDIENKNVDPRKPVDAENQIQTTRRFLYLKTNSYIVRRAAESEIVAYYVADPYQGNSYGAYIYEQTEIEHFLDIYKENRYYYYRVLLNRSFINDKYYNSFEKVFLLYWTIERALGKRAETFFNINSYNRDDIMNFFKSFGLEGMANMLDVGDFIDSEEVSKNIIKRYVSLMQDKGSREVIADMRKIFKDYDLKVSRDVLIKDTEKTVDENNNPIVTASYNLYSIDATSSDPFSEIKGTGGKREKHALSEITSNDQYWTEESTERVSESKYPSGADTKYLTGSMSQELYKAFIFTQFFFATINYLISNNSVIADYNYASANLGVRKLKDYIKTLETIIYKYYALVQNSVPSISECSPVYSLDPSAVNINNLDPNEFYKEFDGYIKDFLSSISTAIKNTDDNQVQQNIINCIENLATIVTNYIGMRDDDIDADGKKYSNTIKIMESLFTTKTTQKIPTESELSKSSINESISLTNGTTLDTVEDYQKEISAEIKSLRDTLMPNSSDKTLLKLVNIEDGKNLSAFVQYCITFFISYTVYLRDFQYTKTFDSKLERPMSGDSFGNVHLTTNQYDYFYYDDSLDVEVINAN